MNKKISLMPLADLYIRLPDEWTIQFGVKKDGRQFHCAYLPGSATILIGDTLSPGDKIDITYPDGMNIIYWVPAKDPWQMRFHHPCGELGNTDFMTRKTPPPRS